VALRTWLRPANCDFGHQLILPSLRMSGKTGRTAACRSVSEGPVWAAHVGRGEIVWQDRCDAANGSKEPEAVTWLTCRENRL